MNPIINVNGYILAVSSGNKKFPCAPGSTHIPTGPRGISSRTRLDRAIGLEEVCVGGTARHDSRVIRFDFVHQTAQLRVTQVVDEGMVAPGLDALPQHDRRPRTLAEHFVVVAHRAPVTREERDLVRQMLRHFHFTACVPVVRIGAPRRSARDPIGNRPGKTPRTTKLQ